MPASPYKWTLGDCDGRCADCPTPTPGSCACCRRTGPYSTTGTLTDSNGDHALAWDDIHGHWSCCYMVDVDGGPTPIGYVVLCVADDDGNPVLRIGRVWMVVNNNTCDYALDASCLGDQPQGTGLDAGSVAFVDATPSLGDPMTASVAGWPAAGDCVDPLGGGGASVSIPKLADDADCPTPTPTPTPTACSPCDIPADDLCFEWSSTESGAGSAPLIYDAGTSTWATGCVEIIDNGSISVILSCSGGNWALSVWYDTDHPDCSLLADASLANGQIAMGDYTCDPFDVHITPINIKLTTTMGFTDFEIARAPCPTEVSCAPCDLPNSDLTLSWTGPVGAGSAALPFAGGYWQTACEHLAYGGTGGAILGQLLCDEGGTQLTIYWNDAQYSCIYPGPFGAHRDQTPTDPDHPGANDHITLTASTCDPLSITFTVEVGSDLYIAGFRTFIVTL